MVAGDASIPVAQCNNIFIFPGIGLAVTAVRATRITDAMMTAAAAAVGDAATIEHDPHGTLLPGRAPAALAFATVVARAVARAAVADAAAALLMTRSTSPSTAPGGYPAISPNDPIRRSTTTDGVFGTDRPGRSRLRG